MTTELLKEAGEALYGPRFQTDLARDLNVSDRTMRRWVAGETLPPKDVWSDLFTLLSGREGDIRRLKVKFAGIAEKVAS